LKIAVDRPPLFGWSDIKHRAPSEFVWELLRFFVERFGKPEVVKETLMMSLWCSPFSSDSWESISGSDGTCIGADLAGKIIVPPSQFLDRSQGIGDTDKDK
jgi:hypothetical protein